jgi:LSD1 subclass zinc finger protein
MLVAQCSKCKNLMEVEQGQQTVRCLCCRLVQKIERTGEICAGTDPADMVETLSAILKDQRRRMSRTHNTPHS